MTAAAACGSPAADAGAAGSAACVAESVRCALDAHAVAIAFVSRSAGLMPGARVGACSPELDDALRRAAGEATGAAPPGTAGNRAPEPVAAPGAAARFVSVPLGTSGAIVAVLTVDLGDDVRRRDIAVAVMQALAGPLAMMLQGGVRRAEPGTGAEKLGVDRRLAVVAHELRRPLAPIASCVTLLRRHGTDVDVRRVAGMMERQVRDLARLVQDLLDEEPADAFDFSVRPQHVDLVMAVQDAIQSVLPLVTARRHRVVSSIEAVALPVTADPLRLRQIIVNLLENAAKYTPVGGRLEVDVRRDADEAVVEVRDSGVGIAPGRLPGIFEDGRRAPSRTEGAGGGRGVGLPLVRRLVVLHRGTVTAASDGPGRGSRFTVRLPLAGNGPGKPRDS